MWYELYPVIAIHFDVWHVIYIIITSQCERFRLSTYVIYMVKSHLWTSHKTPDGSHACIRLHCIRVEPRSHKLSHLNGIKYVPMHTVVNKTSSTQTIASNLICLNDIKGANCKQNKCTSRVVGAMLARALVLCCAVCASAALRVLLVFPLPGASHAILAEGFVTHLIRAGHQVCGLGLDNNVYESFVYNEKVSVGQHYQHLFSPRKASSCSFIIK